jgi:gamma-glutamylcyclotransferase (GGCT)/AIG2-like uncharacterized protein YtfP
MLVTVYGTLLSNERNNRLLKDSEKLGDVIVTGFQMYSLGSFPACVRTDNYDDHHIVGEVWKISDETLIRLDMLEGYPHMYQRTLIDTSWGASWIYTQDRPFPPEKLIPGGNWKQHLEETGRF